MLVGPDTTHCCRAMRGKEARKKCPELQLVQVPLTHGKAELGPYRAAGKQVSCLA